MIKLNKMVKKYNNNKKNYMKPNDVFKFCIAYMDSFQAAIF